MCIEIYTVRTLSSILLIIMEHRMFSFNTNIFFNNGVQYNNIENKIKPNREKNSLMKYIDLLSKLLKFLAPMISMQG